MKKIILILILVLSCSGYAQEIKLNGKTISIGSDGKPVIDKEALMQLAKKQSTDHREFVWDKIGNKPSPEFSYPDAKGDLWTNTNIKGRVTLINFWHTGCGPCIKEMPWLNSLIEKYPNVNFLSSTFNDAQSIKSIVESRPFLFSHLSSAKQMGDSFYVKIYPMTVIIDPQGIVRGVFIDSSEQGQKEIEDLLCALSARQ